ncbi:MAG: exodeoxyribonuclease III [Gammaproteobacteria bacterium]|nr:exodeoxyribonuclease III [Gammaproteobacteria bacterium]
MRVVTLNCNGVRAAARKGFFEWLPTLKADVVCLQETRASQSQLDAKIFWPDDYFCYYFEAQKKGYSGTAIFSKVEPNTVTKGLGFELADDEARYIQADYEGFSVASIYLPSGTSGEVRQVLKMDFLKRLSNDLLRKKRDGREYIICGDWNMCHKEVDLKNWKANRKNSGFLPEEREWLDELYGTIGFRDAFREVNKEDGQYSWWSNRGQARANNVGWRLDYQVVTPGLADKVIKASIFRDKSFSDHAPVIIDYNL